MYMYYFTDLTMDPKFAKDVMKNVNIWMYTNNSSKIYYHDKKQVKHVKFNVMAFS